MKRIILALLVGGVVFGAVFAAAATLGLNGGVIQAGTDSSLYCDTDVDVLGWGLNSGTGLVENVRIGHVAPECVGAGLQARIGLSDGRHYITGPEPAGHVYEVPILSTEPAIGYRLWFKDVNDGGKLVTVDASLIESIDVWIEGGAP